MENPAQELRDYLEDCFEDVNRHGVIFHHLGKSSMYAGSRLLNNKRFELELYLEFVYDYKEFIEELNIKAKKDVKNVTPARLMELYQEGKAEIACYLPLEDLHVLTFKKSGSKLTAENDTRQLHEVGKALETPEQFIAYTRYYYTQVYTD